MKLLVEKKSVFCFRVRALSKTVTVEQLPDKIVPGYKRAYQGVLDTNLLGRIVFVFHFKSLSRHHEIISYFSSFSNKKIKKILGTVSVSHHVSRKFKTYLPDIPSKNVANPASRKSLAGPLARLANIRPY